MKVLLLMLAHLLTTLAKLLGPGGARAIVADSLLMKQQLLIINRSRRRAPNLTPIDRMLLGFWSLFLNPHHIQRAAVILRPSTLLKFHDMLKKRKYRLRYTAHRKGKPGPKGPSQELIEAIVELKQRNPRFGCCPSRKLISHTIMPPTVHNGDVGHRLLEVALPFLCLVTAPIATQDYPFPATDACASDDNS
jgi:hypothetical protein